MENSFIHRPYQFEEYEQVCEWMRARGMDPYPEEFIPACGLVILDNKGPILYSWLFFDNSTPVCFIGLTVLRPGMNFFLARPALVYMVRQMKAEAAYRGAKTMSIYMPKAFGWHKHFEELGFVEDPTSLVNVTVALTEEDAELCLSMQ